MSAPTCRTCGGGFTDNEEVYASDWTVVSPDGTRLEVRYQHVACVVEAWRCDLHGVTTTGDCPKCDGELIALTDGAAS